MPGQVLEILHLFLGNFEVVRLLALLLVVVITLIGVLFCVGWETRDIKAQAEMGDVLVFKLFWHHPILLDVVVR